MEGVEHLAVDIELTLLDGGVADTDGRGVAVPGQPRQLGLRQPPLTGQPVHDLQIVGGAYHRAQQPVPPGVGLVQIARGQQAVQGEAGVTQPAVAVVPVAYAAQLLGQRGGGGRHDAAGGRVGEGLEGDQRAHHGLAVRPLVAAARGPCLPVVHGVLERRERIDLNRPGLMGGVPGQYERGALARRDGEVRTGAEVLAVGGALVRGAQPYGVRSGDRHPAALGGAHPGHHPPVVEPQPQHPAHLDAAAEPLDDPYDIGLTVALRHEVGDPDAARAGLPDGVEDQRVAAVGALGAGVGVPGPQAPVAVVLAAEERGEAGTGIEARQAQPVDGPVAADECGGLQVADERIVLDTWVHSAPLPARRVRYAVVTAVRATGWPG